MTRIYFAEYLDRIKIGISQNVEARIEQINAQAGIQLRIIGTTEGSFSQEKALHSVLDAHRARGEWYRDSPELRVIIARCLDNLNAAIKNPDGKTTPFSKVARAIWPDNTAAHLASIAKTNERTAARWLSGEFEPPYCIVEAVMHETFARD